MTAIGKDNLAMCRFTVILFQGNIKKLSDVELYLLAKSKLVLIDTDSF
jgi:hypothetical protein